MESTTPKIIRFAPTQTARVTTAVAVNLGVLRSNRGQLPEQFIEWAEPACFAALFLGTVQSARIRSEPAAPLPAMLCYGSLDLPDIELLWPEPLNALCSHELCVSPDRP
jgi:hypothetical protein